LNPPQPPVQARTYFGSARRETGLKPVGKYGPTGPFITNNSAFFGFATPTDA